MNIKRIDITEFLGKLSAGHPLDSETLESIIAEIDYILRYDPEAYYKGEKYHFAWDDAWDAMDLLAPQCNAHPYLIKMAVNEGESSSDDQNARKWAIRAISRIDGELSEALPYLQQLQQGDNRDLRQEAKTCLRKRGYKHLVKRRWNDLF